MKRIVILSIVMAAVILQASVASAASSLKWQEKQGESVALVGPKGVIWQFNYSDKVGKPHFHPVALPAGGVLTEAMPRDHVWHYGIWFSWKYINKVNYWEENKNTHKAPGLTSWPNVKINKNDDGSARIAMDLTYHLPGKPPVLTEKRVIEISAPKADGTYLIDWIADYTATQNVVLDRTPLPGMPGGRAWGGYSGLSVRFANALTDRQSATTEGPAPFKGDKARIKAPAADYSGLAGGQPGGIAMLDHPDNPRCPTPWYLIRGKPMGYMNAALIMYEPLELKAGEKLKLRYRLIVHPGRWDAAKLKAEAARYAK